MKITAKEKIAGCVFSAICFGLSFIPLHNIFAVLGL